MIKAVIGTQNQYPFEETIVTSHHPAVIKTMSLSATGILSAGTVLAINNEGKAVAYSKHTQEIGTGDGSEKEFAGTLSNAPAQPGSIIVTVGSVTLTDDGYGNVSGTGGVGTVNYKTGKITVNFDSAPANGAKINVTYSRKIAGILVESTDADKEDACNVLIHGTVATDRLKVLNGSLAASDYEFLENSNIYVMP